MRLEGNETRLERNETRLARNETRGGNLHLSGTVHCPLGQVTFSPYFPVGRAQASHPQICPGLNANEIQFRMISITKCPHC